MLRFSKLGNRAVVSAISLQQRQAWLQSEKPYASLADKIVRGELKKTFYSHPSYVMSREKMLYTIWVDIGVFTTCAYIIFPFFIVAYFFKA
ncbi:hypothetical protein AGDE_00992 [Angomonas deanei]|uniref:Uncharacterized protein n=1 Tax=Angomonas deanei TaxID=59799 RepID=S9WU07_9TRYP|nr:hypothetical protein AGDE_03496 [Angomonas deanei]EPY42931.1 hypothetical protein AGDE_00992 [Angomonas deanei]CAD2219854.1 hypothetical protein, conserved [Angomonas deanei]|eukprot:EPY40432.1 hypothetical protein AGDE_03496 [Angomonas deanei]